MALVPIATRNRVNPIPISTIEQSGVPYGTYDQVEVCSDPNCPVCRAERRDGHHTHHHHHHKKRHNHHHHYRKHTTSFWNKMLPRAESGSSTVTIHNVELDERRPYYSTPVTERALVPVDRTERQVVSRTRTTRRIPDDDVVRDAWTENPTNDDEIVCCRASNGCRCPCWCCIILIILFVILIIVLIVLLATLL